jgi:hypothetical protein
MSYIGLITIVELLNVVQMSVIMCHQANLCHKISTHQIVAASSIDDSMNAAIFDDEKNGINYVIEPSQNDPRGHTTPICHHRHALDHLHG